VEGGGKGGREADPRDGRVSRVRLTERNRAMHASYAAASREMIDVFYGGFSEAEIDAFEDALRRVIANVEAVDGS
jgi:DNA-binding MarR family transcriptional regulator